jgi:hypothetical protein
MEERSEHQPRTRRDDECNDTTDILSGEKDHGEHKSRKSQHSSKILQDVFISSEVCKAAVARAGGAQEIFDSGCRQR